jgi:acyl-CoA synthetase (AMP-forming)/AMP-acid ligase II
MSELAIVGGEKVYPTEVEGVIQELDNVAEAVVYAERNPITGQIVCARVSLVQAEDPKSFVSRLKKHCIARMQSFKVPVRVSVTVGTARQSERLKKIRREGPCEH